MIPTPSRGHLLALPALVVALCPLPVQQPAALTTAKGDPVPRHEATPVLTLRGHTEAVIRVAFCPDGRRLATASGDHTAVVREAATGKRLLTLRGHGDFVSGLTFSPDGRRLATGSGDTTVKVWEAGTGRALLTLPKHNVWVHAVAFCPDGPRLASGDLAKAGDSEDDFVGEVKVWDTNVASLGTNGRD